MNDLVPVGATTFPMASPPVHADLGLGGALPAAPLIRAWLRGDEGAAPGATRLRAAYWASALWQGDPRGTVLLFAGRTEYIEKYLRVIARLTAMGFAVATLDWRGQGMSERSAPHLLGHVDDFAEYQRDVDAFLDWAPVRGAIGPKVLLCHSMGGAIGLRALVDGRLTPDAVIYSAPFWGLGVAGVARGIARQMAKGAVAIGLGMRGLPGGAGDTASETYVMHHGFEDNVLTSDPEHFAWFKAQASARPDLTLGAPTLAWLAAAFRELDALAQIPAPDVPALVLLGSDEQVVSSDAIKSWVARAPDAALTMLPGARHEGLMESPSRAQGKLAWATINGFLRARRI